MFGIQVQVRIFLFQCVISDKERQELANLKVILNEKKSEADEVEQKKMRTGRNKDKKENMV